jgi:hypothetical protein
MGTLTPGPAVGVVGTVPLTIVLAQLMFPTGRTPWCVAPWTTPYYPTS